MDEILRLTVKDLEYIAVMLDQQDVQGALGKCDSHMDDEGYCKMCTAMQRLNTFIDEAHERNAGMWYKIGSEEDFDW